MQVVTINAIRGNARLFLLNIGNVLNSTYMITEYKEYNSNVNFDCLSKLLKECKYSIYLNIYIIIIWDTKTQRCTKLYLQSMVP